MTQHALPRYLAPGFPRHDVFLAVRDRGGAGSTHADMAAATGHAQHHCSLLAWALVQTGHLVDVGWRPSPLDPRWRDRVYVTARDAHLLGPAVANRQTRSAS